MKNQGPPTKLAEIIHAEKYRGEGETFEQSMYRIAGALNDGDAHYRALSDILLDQRFLPGGRVQSAMGSPRDVTAYNCFVSGEIEDNSESIMGKAYEAFMTMRMGGGIGYDFSNIRPRGDRIKTLESRASGPVSFMRIFDAVCQTVCSAGHRRGAQMGILRVDHPDIEEFLRAKQDTSSLTGFNISIGITDEFMMHLKAGKKFPLRFKDEVVRYIDPQNLWDEVMRSTWDWAEPGVVFIDTINKENNLWYCEKIAATNPCGEQPLPPYGACLLGSFNLNKYVHFHDNRVAFFSWGRFAQDIHHVVRAMDNVIDRTIYPLEAQKHEAQQKRRMGLGVLGLANTIEALGFPYGSAKFLDYEGRILSYLRDHAYNASIEIAREKGVFPLYDRKLLGSNHSMRLPSGIQEDIGKYGLRNSHLTSIAPTGTIHITAGCVSSGIEPPYTLEYDRTVQGFDGPEVHRVKDYAHKFWGVDGRTADEVSVQDHLNVLIEAQKYVDSAVSKTCNCGPDVSFEDFKQIYETAWEGGCKGVSTFRAAGKRMGILKADDEVQPEQCTIDPQTGERSCA